MVMSSGLKFMGQDQDGKAKPVKVTGDGSISSVSRNHSHIFSEYKLFTEPAIDDMRDVFDTPLPCIVTLFECGGDNENIWPDIILYDEQGETYQSYRVLEFWRENARFPQPRRLRDHPTKKAGPLELLSDEDQKYIVGLSENKVIYAPNGIRIRVITPDDGPINWGYRIEVVFTV